MPKRKHKYTEPIKRGKVCKHWPDGIPSSMTRGCFSCDPETRRMLDKVDPYASIFFRGMVGIIIAAGLAVAVMCWIKAHGGIL